MSRFFYMEQIKEILSYGYNKIMYERDISQRFAKVYFETFNEEVCSTCPDVLYRAFLRLKNLTSEKFTIMKSHNLKIKKGVLLDTYNAKDPSIMGHFTSESVIDEAVAAKLQKMFPESFEEVIEEKEEDTKKKSK